MSQYRLSGPAQLDAEEFFGCIAADDFDTALRIERELLDSLIPFFFHRLP